MALISGGFNNGRFVFQSSKLRVISLLHHGLFSLNKVPGRKANVKNRKKKVENYDLILFTGQTNLGCGSVCSSLTKRQSPTALSFQTRCRFLCDPTASHSSLFMLTIFVSRVLDTLKVPPRRLHKGNDLNFYDSSTFLPELNLKFCLVRFIFMT